MTCKVDRFSLTCNGYAYQTDIWVLMSLVEYLTTFQSQATNSYLGINKLYRRQHIDIGLIVVLCIDLSINISFFHTKIDCLLTDLLKHNFLFCCRCVAFL